MALTLTQTAKLTKRGLLFLGIFTFLLVAGLSAYQIWYKYYYLPHKPPVVEKPDTLWAALDMPIFPSSAVSSSNFSYTLSTETGGLPLDFPKIIKVYSVPLLGTNFLAEDKAANLASSLGFPNGPDKQNPTQYKFTDSLGGQLLIDLDSGNFVFQREATSSASLENVIPEQSKIIQDFRAYLSSHGLLKDDLKNGPAKVTYSNLSQQESTSAAVTIWPDKLNNLEVVTEDVSSGLIKAVASKARDELNRYLKLNYTYWGPDLVKTSTYPIRTPNEAFADLQNGKGVVVVEPKTPKVSITSVKLSYYESSAYSRYIEPIYVFEGEGFVAYLPAVTEQFLSSQSSSRPNPSAP